MDLDTDSEVNVPDAPERDDNDNVTLVDVDAASDTLADLPSAEDFEAMKAVVFQPLVEEPEIITEDHFTWEIDNWRQKPKKAHSPVFEAGGHKWRVLFFPFGQDGNDQCSFYLEYYSEEPIPDDWYCCVQFGLVLYNRNNPRLFSNKTAQHRFTKAEGDWGFTKFENLRAIFSQEWNGSGHTLVENESANMRVMLRIVKDETGILWHTFRDYDSKKETGYVGLKNQGATCYLNSLLQSLYFTNAFRKAVYQIPTENEENLMNSAYTLQRLFYQLQSSKSAVSTNELTKSFGWQTRHIFEQQDVQELSRKLMERMEEKMKGTSAENVLPRLFCGKQKTYISCINVDYESSRIEDFWDIQLNVRGRKDIEDSFKDYVQVEKMDGENQYFAGDEYKLQDANKGVIFQSFPEVLHLQLKRFEYDIERDAMMKVNDRYEFPETFDASPYLSEDADKSEPYIYNLHGVLVHSGDLNAGHYYAFIKPTKDGWFYKYDDDRVTRATKREVLEENFGGEVQYPPGVKGPYAQPPGIRQNSAYMLVYIRQSRLDQVLCPVTEDDSPPHLRNRLRAEIAEREALKKEREEQHLYSTVEVVTDDIFKAHGGTDLTVFGASASTPGAAKSYRVLKTYSYADLAGQIAKDWNKPAEQVRLWKMVNRQNKTVRPDEPISEPSKLVGSQKHQTGTQQERLYAEFAVDFDKDNQPIWYGANGPVKGDHILLFLKMFNVEKQKLEGIGHVYMSKERKVEELLPIIAKMMGWPEKATERPKIKLFEEIKPQMIEAMALKSSLKAAELQDGDIICFQREIDNKYAVHEDKDAVAGALSKLVPSIGHANSKATTNGGSTQRPAGWIDEAPQYYDYLCFRKVIHFKPHPKNPEPFNETFDLEMSAKYSYDQIAGKVGERLRVDPTHLRFHTVTNSSGAIKAPVKRLQNQNLTNILTPSFSTFANNNTKSDELYFEILEMSLSEFDTKKALRVIWLTEGISKEEPYDLLVPKNGTMGDVLSLFMQKAQLEDEATAGPIRMFAVHNNKIYKELSNETNVFSLSDFVTIYAERIPEEERNAAERGFIHCYHFQGETNRAHGIPFKFLVKEGEPFSETRKRLETRTGIKQKYFEKIKFAVIKRNAYTKPIYLNDDSVIWELAPGEEDALGLDHIDRTTKKGNAGPDLFLK